MSTLITNKFIWRQSTRFWSWVALPLGMSATAQHFLPCIRETCRLIHWSQRSVFFSTHQPMAVQMWSCFLMWLDYYSIFLHFLSSLVSCQRYPTFQLSPITRHPTALRLKDERSSEVWSQQTSFVLTSVHAASHPRRKLYLPSRYELTVCQGQD